MAKKDTYIEESLAAIDSCVDNYGMISDTQAGFTKEDARVAKAQYLGRVLAARDIAVTK